MKSSKSSPWIDQPELNDICPCGSQKQFGACCGSNSECPCKSHRSAGDCCYSPPTENEIKKMGEK